MSETSLQDLFGSIDIYVFDQLLKGRLVPGMRVLDAGCGAGRNLVYFFRNGYEVFGVDESEEAILRVRKLAAALAPHLPAENFRVEAVERMSFKTADGKWQTASSPSTDSTEGNGEPGTVNREEKEEAGNMSTAMPVLPANSSGFDEQDEEAGRDACAPSYRGFDVVLSSAVLHFARDEEQWQAMVDEMWRVLKPGGIFFARLASTIGIESRVQLIEARRYHLPDGSDRFLVDQAMLQRVTAAFGGEFIEPIKTTIVENLRAMTTWVVRKK